MQTVSSESNINLFVYGTLRRRKSNTYILKNERYIGEAETVKKYAMYDFGLPAVIKYLEISKIKGDLYCVSNKKLEFIDRFEGHPFFYKREIIDIRVMGNKEIQQAYIYFYPHKEGTLIKKGDWYESTV